MRITYVFFLSFSFQIAALASKPVATITSPIHFSTYEGGQIITVSGMAYDSLDGDLPATAFTWYIELHHGDHVHDGPPEFRNKKSATYTISQTNELSADVFYRIKLIVINSIGNADTAQVDIKPNIIRMLFRSVPDSMEVSVFSLTTFKVPQDFETVHNMAFQISVKTPQIVRGDTLDFQMWKELNTSSTGIFLLSPGQDFTITAVFKSRKQKSDTISSIWVNHLNRPHKLSKVKHTSYGWEIEMYDEPVKLYTYMGVEVPFTWLKISDGSFFIPYIHSGNTDYILVTSRYTHKLWNTPIKNH